jgi:hypothetical protein
MIQHSLHRIRIYPPQILADNSDWLYSEIHPEKDSTAIVSEDNTPYAKKFFPTVSSEIQSNLEFWHYFDETTNDIGDKVFCLFINQSLL